ncbi:hypothetical protein ACFVY4_07560 [Streptomyces sp. NPDC058299]|uniref:hypothetical protein n=1 Tax=Streptomyces sp. NPDC058299 TaxID=3346435 RepID=UPI0036E1C80D
MSTLAAFPAPGAYGDEDATLDVIGKLTAEQNASFAAGLLQMQPIPAPSELQALTAAAVPHPAVTLDKDAVQALLAGVTHHHEVLDQLAHPETMAAQLHSARSNGRKNAKTPLPAVSPLGRLNRLTTDMCYASAVHSPLHQLPGLKVLPVNPRFIALLQHAFTKGRVTDPAIEGSTPGLLETRLPTQAHLRDMMVQTVQHHLLDYDWSDSIARTGIQQPLVGMAMRVHYDDGHTELIVVVIDGQSRLVSAWRNTLKIDGRKLTSAEARSYAEQIVGRMFAHDAVSATRKTVNDALQTAATHSWTAREVLLLHSHVAPVNLVLGTFTRTGEPCDATQWFTEFLTQIHLRTRSWGGGSDREKAVADALSAAVRAEKLTQDEAAALSGRLHGAAFTRATRLPFHPAFARAALFEAVLSAGAGPHIRAAIAEYLSLDPNDKGFPRKLLEVVAIFATRFLRSDGKTVFPQVVHTWADGGAITREMWARVPSGENAFTLTRLEAKHLDLPPRMAAKAAVEHLRKRAEEDDPTARDELAVLGGDALIVAEALTRDRGSKEDLISTTPQDKKTPYRSKPPSIVAALRATKAGRLMLSEALADWVAKVPGQPEDFSRGFVVPKIEIADDGHPKIVAPYGLTQRATEWDVFDTAYPGLSSSRRNQVEARQKAARAAVKNGNRDETESVTLKTLQTDITRVQLTIEKILSSGNPLRFAEAAHREELQQLLWKLGGEVRLIPVDVPTPSGDPYALAKEGE